MPSLAIVIVSWNVRELLRRCLEAVERSLAGSGISHRVLVVDNGSRDGTPAMLRADFPQVELLEAGANLGFAGGNNLALRALGLGPGGGAAAQSSQRATFSTPDYVLLLNPDTEPLGEALPRLVAELEARPELAAAGPRLRYPDGSPQPSRRRFPTRLTLLFESTPLERAWPGNPWARRYRMADMPEEAPQTVGWLVGAALLVRSGAIRRAGLLDERFFMYSEELEWERRLGGQGAIGYLPAAEVIHHEGKSSEQAVAARYLRFQGSRVLLARIWYGWPFAAALRAFYRACFAYDLAVEAAKLALGHRPGLRRQRIAVYWRVIREL